MAADITQVNRSIQSLIQKQLEIVHKALGIGPVEKQDDELALEKPAEGTGLEQSVVNSPPRKPIVEELAEEKRYLVALRNEARTRFAHNQAIHDAAKARFMYVMAQRRLIKERISKTKS